MALLDVLAPLAAGVGLLVGLAAALLLDRERLRQSVTHPRARLRAVAPHLALLLSVLVLNRLFRDLGQELSWLIGWNITGLIFAVEGSFVGWVQSIASPALTVVLSAVYLYGYVFLAVFPLVAYWTDEAPTPLQRTLLAYTLNYAVGLVCYVLFIAFGPRNLIPGAVDELLYATYPQSQLLTSTVNTNTNAFPSLHTSVSVTVALLAARTRETYRWWFRLAVALAALVVLSTMYLGIHWATDVVAGVLLAVASVRVADRYHRLDTLRSLVPSRRGRRSGEYRE